MSSTSRVSTRAANRTFAETLRRTTKSVPLRIRPLSEFFAKLPPNPSSQPPSHTAQMQSRISFIEEQLDLTMRQLLVASDSITPNEIKSVCQRLSMMYHTMSHLLVVKALQSDGVASLGEFPPAASHSLPSNLIFLGRQTILALLEPEDPPPITIPTAGPVNTITPSKTIRPLVPPPTWLIAVVLVDPFAMIFPPLLSSTPMITLTVRVRLPPPLTWLATVILEDLFATTSPPSPSLTPMIILTVHLSVSLKFHFISFLTR